MFFFWLFVSKLWGQLSGETWNVSFNNLFRANVPPRLPGVQANEPEEKSFAGQLHTDIRLPFGPNPRQHTIETTAMIAKPGYRKGYQKNIYNVQPTSNVDWRLDNDFNSRLNNMTEYHMPEPHVSAISNFWNKRAQQR